ncbi:MAG: HAD family phosphatase [Bacteroidetes bacterium]|nr:HAD family phosphatase [Bacteroidota bacterium]MCW5896842.1 HAD family phosphatase [Bacteroidota bacterium]
MPGTKFEAVIFDLDGLMIDTERIASDAWLRASSEMGYPLTEHVVHEMIGRTGPDSDAILRRNLGEEVALDELKALRLSYTDDHIINVGIPLKPGLLELLDFLDGRGIRKAVATSSTRERAAMKLKRTGLFERFRVVVSGDDVHRGKPAPDIYLETAGRLDVSANGCLVLEDSDAGARSAHAAGMSVIIVPDLKPPGADVVAFALHVEQSLSDVLHVLPQII